MEPAVAERLVSPGPAPPSDGRSGGRRRTGTARGGSTTRRSLAAASSVPGLKRCTPAYEWWQSPDPSGPAARRSVCRRRPSERSAPNSADERPAQPVIVGQLTFRTPRNAPSSGQYALFVIDKCEPQASPGHLGDRAPAHEHRPRMGRPLRQGGAKYPGDRGLASIRTGSANTDPGMAVDFAPNMPSPITFAAEVDPQSPSITDPARQLTVALVSTAAPMTRSTGPRSSPIDRISHSEPAMHRSPNPGERCFRRALMPPCGCGRAKVRPH